MEFCAGIPGSIGGAVRMNAGAYGSEIKNVVETIELMNTSGKIRQCKKNILKFTYRNLDLPGTLSNIAMRAPYSKIPRGEYRPDK